MLGGLDKHSLRSLRSYFTSIIQLLLKRARRSWRAHRRLKLVGVAPLMFVVCFPRMFADHQELLSALRTCDLVAKQTASEAWEPLEAQPRPSAVTSELPEHMRPDVRQVRWGVLLPRKETLSKTVW